MSKEIKFIPVSIKPKPINKLLITPSPANKILGQMSEAVHLSKME